MFLSFLNSLIDFDTSKYGKFYVCYTPGYQVATNVVQKI